MKAASILTEQQDREVASIFYSLARFNLIIDARTPREFADDHIPGAINLPVVDDAQFAQVGIEHKRHPHTAYVIGAQFALRNIADHVAALADRLKPGTQVLVYCARGGKRSQAWAAPLKTMGIATTVLPGGWRTYRRRVLDGIDQQAARLQLRVLAGPTGSGKTQLLAALAAAGEQVLDLEALASHRGSLLGALPGAEQPAQKLFEGSLWMRLRAFDPGRVVYVEDESRKIGRLHVPTSLVSAIRSAPVIELSAPRAARVQQLLSQYRHLTLNRTEIERTLQPLAPLVGNDTLARWAELARGGQFAELVDQLLAQHYDPAYARGAEAWRKRRGTAAQVYLETLEQGAFERAAASVKQLCEAAPDRTAPVAPTTLVLD